MSTERLVPFLSIEEYTKRELKNDETLTRTTKALSEYRMKSLAISHTLLFAASKRLELARDQVRSLQTHPEWERYYENLGFDKRARSELLKEDGDKEPTLEGLIHVGNVDHTGKISTALAYPIFKLAQWERGADGILNVVPVLESDTGGLGLLRVHLNDDRQQAFQVIMGPSSKLKFELSNNGLPLPFADDTWNGPIMTQDNCRLALRGYVRESTRDQRGGDRGLVADWLQPLGFQQQPLEYIESALPYLPQEMSRYLTNAINRAYAPSPQTGNEIQ